MRRLGLRFLVVFAFLQTLPFPLRLFPFTRGLVVAYFEGLAVAVRALAAVLGLPEPVLADTGSGDTLFAYLSVLLFAITAFAIASGWTLVSRRDDARVVAVLRVWLRFFVASVLFWYGLAKLFEIQFHTPPSWILDQRVGDKSPMGLMWTFMGHSRPYTVGVGALECIGSVLLVWRRLATIGAAVLAVVMTNVVAMNFSYDVPVKLWSMQLLAGCLVIMGPDLRRLAATALGHAVPEVVPPPRGTLWWERGRTLLRYAFVVMLASGLALGRRVDELVNRDSELDGTWNVKSGGWSRLMIDNGIAVLRGPDEQRRWYRAIVHPVQHEVELHSPLLSGVLTYERADPDHLVLRGVVGTTRYDMTLERAPAWLLETRGFHWIQEQPFNR